MNPEAWITELSKLTTGKQPTTSLSVVLLLLLVAFVASLWIAWLYAKLGGCRLTGTQIHRSFPLVAIAVTSIFLAVQYSLPLSLGLLGALSIVRFRTPIKQPEEIGFLLLVIAAALATATFNLHFLVALLAVATLALALRRFVRRLLPAGEEAGSLLLALPSTAYAEHRAALEALVAAQLPAARLESLTAEGGQTVLTWSFRGGDDARLLAAEAALRALVAPTQLSLVTASPQLP
jgi:hypothetical protein